jgi:hypothetical protein
MAMKRLLMLAVAGLTSLGVAHAEESKAYQCAKQDDVRSVVLQYSDAGGAPMCRVLYRKAVSADAPARSLWEYQAHLDMCERQTQSFLKKLEGYGLACSPDALPATKSAAAR